MKERPILFSAPMVRAILDRRKTQTRRVAKRTDSGRVKAVGSPKNYHIEDPAATLACPYGQPGDRLWVRETFFEMIDGNTVRPFDPPRYAYRATDLGEFILMDGDGAPEVNRDGSLKSPWIPSIHMPRRASRIILEIDSVRLEWLHSISEEDAIAEGVELAYPTTEATWYRDYLRPESDVHTGGLMPSAAESFETLWESINGSESWDANPLVWVVNFRRISP